MKKFSMVALWFLAVACSGSGREARLREALAQTHVPLAQSVDTAEESVAGVAIKARLLVDGAPVYSVGALAASELRDVRVDLVSGAVLSKNRVSAAAAPCAGSVGLTEAIAVAEAERNGEAVSVQPDDDDACNREIQVLTTDILWEVKVGPSGTVLEVEISDEDDE